MAKEIPHLTYRLTEERKQLIDDLRKLFDELRPGEGERVHGVLTTAQILDWALDHMHGTLIAYKTDVARDQQRMEFYASTKKKQP